MLYQPIAQLHGLNHLLAAGRASGERVFEILDTPIDVADAEETKDIQRRDLSIHFENVSFQYPERAAVISNLNLLIEKNKVTALVGHTGAGKTTIANLAMRTYDASSGQITFADEKIQTISLKSLKFVFCKNVLPKTVSHGNFSKTAPIYSVD